MRKRSDQKGIPTGNKNKGVFLEPPVDETIEETVAEKPQIWSTGKAGTVAILAPGTTDELSDAGSKKDEVRQKQARLNLDAKNKVEADDAAA